jgi:general secretion pathway protein D
MAHVLSRLGLFAALALLVTGCATSAAMRAGERAEGLQDFDRAIVEYTKAVASDPDNQNARLALERMKLRSSLEHFTRGRRLEAAGRLEDALIELQIAAELNPTSPDIEERLLAVRKQLQNKIAAARDGKTEIQAMIERVLALPPPGRELPNDVKLPTEINFSDASARVIYITLGKMANLSVTFDQQFRDSTATINLRNPTVEGALQAISTATRNFYQVTGPRAISVVPDTPAKRQEYEDEVVQTFFLSNADPKTTVDLLRIVVDARRVAPVEGANAISVKDTPERVAAVAKLLQAVDKARPEVVVDVEIIEVDRSRFKEFGLQLASPESVGISGGATINRDDLTVRDARRLGTGDVVLTSLPGLFYRLLKTDSNTRTLANTQLRSSEGMPAQAAFGERVPIPITVFSPIATGGIAQQPITSFQYQNIGVNIDITPRIHHDDEVSLSLKLEVSSISGSGFGDLPTFGNRSISTVIRLRDGETNLLAGLIRDDERQVLSGIPGLSDIPVVGKLFARSTRETTETDVVLTLTPRIIRVLDLDESDLRAFRVGRDSATGGPVELPLPPQPLPEQQPAPPPQQPQPQPPAVAPILPPVPQQPER